MPSSKKTKSVEKGRTKAPLKELPTAKHIKAKAKPVQVNEMEVDEDEDSEDDNGGIDEEGMERLLKALGDDGLDDFERAELEATLGGADSDPQEEDGDSEEGGQEYSEVEEEEVESEVEGEELVQLDDVEAVIEDAIPIQKVEINNEVALARIRETMQLDPSLSWTETLVVSYPHTIDVDVNDDLNRELAFYKQALHSASHARKLVSKSFPNFPWTRPTDYFAEMVKSDVHMERIRQKLLDEKAGIKKSEEKRKEREGKKFGKQVQIEKLKERERGKKEMEERLKGLKRKRKDILDTSEGNDDAFDIAVEDAISDRPAKRGRGSGGGSKLTRQSRDKKYGFGGAGRRSKQNTAASTDNFTSGSRRGISGGRGRAGARGGFKGGVSRGGSKRPGKSKRMASRSK